jgi:hypothetical protein
VQGRQAQAPGENRSTSIFEYSKIFIFSVMYFNPLAEHFIIKKTAKKTKLVVPLVPEPGRRPKGGEEGDKKLSTHIPIYPLCLPLRSGGEPFHQHF